MSVFINGEFNANTDGVVDMWSDSKRIEFSPLPNQRYIQTIVKMPDFETAEHLIAKAVNSKNYRHGQSTADELKRIIQSMQFR